jgi:hypothetical protein
MRCDICRGPIKPLLNESGEVVWNKGHNPEPLTQDNLGNDLPGNARCCDVCNGDVILARILEMNGKILDKKLQVPQ